AASSVLVPGAGSLNALADHVADDLHAFLESRIDDDLGIPPPGREPGPPRVLVLALPEEDGQEGGLERDCLASLTVVAGGLRSLAEFDAVDIVVRDIADDGVLATEVLDPILAEDEAREHGGVVKPAADAAHPCDDADRAEDDEEDRAPIPHASDSEHADEPQDEPNSGGEAPAD